MPAAQQSKTKSRENTGVRIHEDPIVCYNLHFKLRITNQWWLLNKNHGENHLA
jgi:hypothetical protein